MVNLDHIRLAAYTGYDTQLSREIDNELTRISPKTPCGEYLRRFWHPVAISSELKDLPIAIRILGEDLILFRDQSSRVGLVHKRCPHRQASLEFAKCEQHGIRCCYHGWHFDIDGTLLDAPGQPPALAERLKARIRLGAYPALEYRGLIFAYLGPLRHMPELPIYDTFHLPNMDLVPYRARFRCNWLQVLDAIVDPLHTSFLHSNIGRVQFSKGFGEVGQLDFFERSAWLLGVNTRRVGDNIWMRINELVLPNFTQAGAAFATDGTKQRYYGRSAFSRWVVPIDDENTLALAWANFGDRGDPPECNTPEGPELIEQGELFDRTYEQRQRSPGDAEAVEGMGPITIHKNENLVISDKGVALMRRLLRRQIREVAAGNNPLSPMHAGLTPIPTYGGDSVLRIPGNDGDESGFLSKLAHEFVEAQFSADGMPEIERVTFVSNKLKEMEMRTRVGDHHVDL